LLAVAARRQGHESENQADAFHVLLLYKMVLTTIALSTGGAGPETSGCG
jgi:hypothetical protein